MLVFVHFFIYFLDSEWNEKLVHFKFFHHLSNDIDHGVFFLLKSTKKSLNYLNN